MEKDKSKKIIDFISSAAPFFNQLPWLACYISSKNRFYPQNHILYFQKKIKRDGFLSLSIKLLKCQVILVIELYKLLLAKVLFSGRIRKVRDIRKKNGKLFVLKSFAYFSSFKDGKYQDPFFKDLVPVLNEKATVLHLVDSLVPFRLLKESDSFILPIHSFLNVFDLVKVEIILIKEFLAFPFSKNRKEFVKKGAWEEELSALYHQEIVNPQTFINLCFFFIGKNLAKNLSESASFFYTYENNSWERLITLGLKDVNPEIKISSVQHSVMPEASVNFYIGEDEAQILDFTDKVYITGSYPLSLFQKYSSLEPNKIEILGTTRFNYLFENLSPSEKYSDGDFDVLIALEGVPEAGEVIDRFIENCIEKSWKPKTLLRLHPAFGIELLSKYLKYKVEDFPFIEVSSERSVINDLFRSKCLVYWGSTCSLEGLMMGKPVIQCDIKSELSYDPLGQLQYNRYVWSETDDLETIFKGILGLASEERSMTSEKGKDFVRNYFQKLKPEVVLKFSSFEGWG